MQYIKILLLLFLTVIIIPLFAQPVKDSNSVVVTPPNPSNTISISSHQIPPNSDRIVIVYAIGVIFDSAPTFNGTPMDLGISVQHASSSLRIGFWYTTLGTSGSPITGDIDLCGATLTTLAVTSYSNVEQAVPIDNITTTMTATSGSFPISNSSINVSSEANDLVNDFLSFFDQFHDVHSIAEGTGQTSIINDNTGSANTLIGTSSKPGAANVPMSWSLSETHTHPNANHASIHIGFNINHASILPVELTDFRVQQEEEHVALSWITATELNNDFFMVERSADGKTFTAIAEIKGEGNSETSQFYSYTDTQPLDGTNYYRLRQIDIDGHAEVYPIQTIFFARNNNATIFPNPGNGTVLLSFEIPPEEEITLQIFDTQGQSIQKIALPPLSTSFPFDTSILSTQGLYFIQISTKNSRQQLSFLKL